MKVSELEGVELNLWVGKAKKLGVRIEAMQYGDMCVIWYRENGDDMWDEYTPTTSDAQAGALIGEFLMNIEFSHSREMFDANVHSSRTKLHLFSFGRAGGWRIAVCRAVVASVYGEEVSDD